MELNTWVSLYMYFEKKVSEKFDCSVWYAQQIPTNHFKNGKKERRTCLKIGHVKEKKPKMNINMMKNMKKKIN